MNLNDLKAMKCKTCGEPLDINLAQNGVIKCAVCESCFTLPKTADQKVLDFLSQGEHDLDTGKFDDAYSAFNKACELDKTEPEAYWGMALAEFKIQYLKDEVNNRLQPICHEISDKDFADSSYFLKALRYATEAQKTEYERKADEINYIKSEFYKIANTGVKYDCFICVKVSDENGGRTQDYKAADDIYFELKGKGYKPFFSERELVGVTGADYEARILYALKSSECMLVVCFDEAYLRTNWVKNEYSRFLKLVNDEEKESDSIALVFGDRPIEKLPGKKGKIQGIALNSLTAMERIVSFVDSHTPEARKRMREEARQKEQGNEALKQRLAELEDRLKNGAQATLSDDELFERTERARLEREQKERKELAAVRAAKRKRRIKLFKRLAIIITPVLVVIMGLSIFLGIWCTPRFKYTLNDDGKSYSAVYIGAKYTKLKTVNVPSRHRNKPVTALGDDAFRDFDSVTKIIIPKSVKEIGTNAFYGCGSLTTITIPDSVTLIGDHAFANCSELKSITIPNSATEIGDYAFLDCGSLTTITISDSVTRIGFHAFAYCAKLKSVIISNSVKEIGAYAFAGCGSLTDIIIPESVETIGNSAFYACGKLTIKCATAREPSGWSVSWNATRPVVWGYEGN